MQDQAGAWRAAVTVWGVVNALNLLQTVGFLSRVQSGSMAVNHVLGYGVILLAIPASVALVVFVRADTGWLHWTGPVVFLAFVALMVVVDYAWPLEFRTPARYAILAPYLVLFFGAILLMGLPMFRLNRHMWFITVATTIMLMASMGLAMRKGVA